jgi:hypothetical protein
MLLADGRIELDPRPAPVREAALPVVMLGHCPGTARWDRLADDQGVMDAIATLGFHREVRRLRALADDPLIDAQDGDETLRALYGLPFPLLSLGQFQALFPDAFSQPTRYKSLLAGDRAWLPLAVQDFFENAEPLPAGAKQLWLIRVDENAENERLAFLPNPEADHLVPEGLHPFDRALLIPGAAVIALPDLERLQIPADLPDIPRVRLANPQPVFLPCGTEIDDTHRERRNPDEMPDRSDPLHSREVIPPILRALARYRPDMQCLLALPLDPDARSESPQPSAAALSFVAEVAGIDPETGAAAGSPHGELYPKLRHIQLLYPYLRGPDRLLSSPVGLVAGMQAEVSQRQGTWRSAAGRPLPGRSLPYPPLDQHLATGLRETPGVGVLIRRRGRVELDDERLAGPVVQVPAFRSRREAQRQDEHYRSGEVARFLGWLRRELTELGERLVFDADPRDPRAAIALNGFFTRLHALGALRGRLPEQSFSVRQRDGGEGVLAFDIDIAPSFPIDRIRLTFAQDRNAGATAIGLEPSDA